MVGALQAAITDTKEHVDDPDGEMGSEERQYESGDVVILLHPEPGTWVPFVLCINMFLA